MDGDSIYNKLKVFVSVSCQYNSVDKEKKNLPYLAHPSTTLYSMLINKKGLAYYRSNKKTYRKRE